MASIRAIRGMTDLLPEQTAIWQYVEQAVAEVAASYAYQEIRFPIVEQTELFKRSIGEVTDIVEKEMYTFADRNGESLTLRPEGTASCVRACLQHGLLNQSAQRLWYQGPMFRYERPQKGRQRQFHQIGVETFGMASPDIDAEVILLSARLWQRLGIAEHVTLQINSIGSVDARVRYRQALVDFLSERIDLLDDDSQRRLDSNPLRILDSKNPETQALLDSAPDLLDFIDEESKTHFSQLRALLDAAGISYEINSRLVRGLDYYCKTVFEWVTDQLGAQGTVCAGGRYDGLVEQLGGKSTPAVGFALGMERLTLLIDAVSSVPTTVQDRIDAYLVAVGDSAVMEAGVELAETLRQGLPQLRLLMHCGGGSFKSQMKKADKSGAKVALILGEDELAVQQVSVKSLRTTDGQHSTDQRRVAFTVLCDDLSQVFNLKS